MRATGFANIALLCLHITHRLYSSLPLRRFALPDIQKSANSPGQLLGLNAVDEEPLLVGSFAGDEFDLGFFKIELLAQEFDEGLVGFTLLGRLSHANFQHAALLAANLVAARAGLRSHGQDGSVRMLLKGDHWFYAAAAPPL